MVSIVDVILTALASVLASSGFWAFIQSRSNKNSAVNTALGALLRHEMFEIYAQYRDAEEVPRSVQDEMDALWEPYHALGYNHTGEKIHDEIMHKKTAIAD